MTPGTNGKDYYGILEEIYELQFRGAEPFSPVIFKCRWFDPEVSRQYPHLGLVETRQDSSMKVIMYGLWPHKYDPRMDD